MLNSLQSLINESFYDNAVSVSYTQIFGSSIDTKIFSQIFATGEKYNM